MTLGPGPLVFVNNSRETFTSDRSGAIATCIWELCRAAERATDDPVVITRLGEGERYPAARVLAVRRARAHRGALTRIADVTARAAGWARADQRSYAHDVLRLLGNTPAGVVVVNNDPELAAFLARRLKTAAIVHWFHNLEQSSHRARRQIVLNSRIRLVAVSDYLARAVENVYGLAPFRVGTVLNGVDSRRFATGQVHTGVPVIGFAGRVAVEKGVDTLLDACLILSKRNRDFELQIVGDTNWGRSDGGPYGKRVAGLLDELARSGVRLRRRGHLGRDQVPAALAQTDIHVVPSRWDEPLGLTVLEGMSCGLAVVGTSVGGIPELLWRAGRLVPREDPEALADVLDELLVDEAQRAALGHAARARAVHLSWDRTWAELARTAVA